MVDRVKENPAELLLTGWYHGVVAFVEDIGYQPKNFDGRAFSMHQIIFVYELEPRKQNGQPYVLSEFYNFNLSRKSKLRTTIELFIGLTLEEVGLNEYNLQQLVGVNCWVYVVEVNKADGSEYNRITSLCPYQKESKQMVVSLSEPPDWIENVKGRAVKSSTDQIKALCR